MPYLAGFLSKLGMRIESDQGLVSAAYPTTEATADSEEVKLKGYDLVPLISEGIDDAHEFENDDSIVGVAGVKQSDRVSREPAGSVVVQGMYDGMDAGIACALGGERWSTPLYTVGTAVKTGTDGVIFSAGTTFSSAGSTFGTEDVGKFIRFNLSGTNDTEEGEVRRISARIDSNTLTITPAATNTDIGNLGFEIANEFDHVFMPTNYLHDELWTDVYSDYSTAGIGTASDLMIRRMTVGIAKSVSLWVYRACMVNTLKISGNAKSGVQFEYGLIPFDRVTDSLSGSRQDGTTVEGWKTNLTYSNSGLFTPAINERILFSDLVFRIGDYSTDTPLTSADNLGISAFEININNNLDTSAHDSVSGEYRKVPLRNGKREVTGSFTCPRYVADTFFTKRDANTILMAFLYFTGSTITTKSRYLRIFLPSIKVITTTAPIGSSATIPITVTFQAFIPAGQAIIAPTYTITNPNPDIIIETGNQNPFNLFRDQNKEY